MIRASAGFSRNAAARPNDNPGVRRYKLGLTPNPPAKVERDDVQPRFKNHS
jgi:hypothetical protein